MIPIAYDYDTWIGYGRQVPLSIDISTHRNCHILLCGMSGAGKSYALLRTLALIIKTIPTCEIHFGDYKQEEAFSFLRRETLRYYGFHTVTDAINLVYNRLQARITNTDTTKNPVILVIDEYVAYMASLQNTDKKMASSIMSKIAEILLMGRSLDIRIICTCQRPDAVIFPLGSRSNYGIIICLGASLKSTYEMLLPSAEYFDEIGDRTFSQGEGIMLIQNSELRFIKIPQIDNMDKVKELCIKGLS